MLDGKNGTEILNEILKRAEEISLIPAKEQASASVGNNVAINPDQLVNAMKQAARQLGDGVSFEPASYVPKNDAMEMMGQANTDPIAQAAQGPELSGAVKQAVLEQFIQSEEKTASLSAGARKAMLIGLPMAGLGAGYAGGRIHGKAIDRKNNRAYYEAGIYDAARTIAARITGRGGK